MARTKQKIINFHSPNTSGTSAFAASAISYGEIAVRHHPSQPELYVRTGENTYAVFVDLAKTQALIDSVGGSINNDLVNLSAATQAFSGEVKTNYAKKSETGTAYTNATAYTNTAYSNATAYTNTVSGYIKTALGGYATTATTSAIDNRVTQLEAFSGEVKTNYATKSETGTAYTNATSYATSKANTAYNNATAYTNTVSGNIKTALGGYATTATTTGIDNRVTQLSGVVQDFSAGTVSYINNKLSNVYVYQGSVANYAALTAKTGMVVGDVWNVIAANGTIPAGTNYAWNGTEWDALGGSVDLSVYTLTATTAAIDNRVQQLEAFSGEVKTNYAKKSETGTAYTNATAYTNTAYSNATAYTNTAYSNATAYTKTVSGNIKTALGGYATTATTSAIDNRVTQLSGATQGIETTANSALQGYTLGSVSTGDTHYSTQSGAKSAYITGGTAKLDLSELIIDCGDF